MFWRLALPWEEFARPFFEEKRAWQRGPLCTHGGGPRTLKMSRLRSAPKTGNIMWCLQIVWVANKKSGWAPKIFPKTARISKTARFQFRPLPAARQFSNPVNNRRQNWFSIIKWRRISRFFPLGPEIGVNTDGLLCLWFGLAGPGLRPETC